MSRRLFTDEQEQFLRENYKGIGNIALTDLMNDTFGLSVSSRQVKAFKNRHKLDSGLNGFFEKGQTPWNKGKKGWRAPGSEKGWFKKGEVPPNTRRIGDERVGRDGYIYVKVQDEGGQYERWKLKHRLLWEQHQGVIPEGYNVVFKDKDKTNLVIDNLELVSGQELALMNKNKLFTRDKELTMCGILLSRIQLKIKE